MPALATGAEFTLFTWFTRTRAWYVSQPIPTFEAVTFGLAVLAGLFLMPALIYLVGSLVLNDYANGGVFALYGDFFKGLFEPRASCWVVLFGPYVFLTLLRSFRLVLRKL